MRWILSIAVASLLLAPAAEAVISTGFLFSQFDEGNGTRPVSCFVANTTNYLRKVRVTLIEDIGNVLAQQEFEIAPGLGVSLTNQFGFVVRCSVQGLTNAGEAGIRATLCNYYPPVSKGGGSAACLDAR